VSTIERHWTGYEITVRRAVEVARHRGQLVDVQWLPASPGRASAVVRLRPHVLPAAPRTRRSSWWWAAGLGAAGTVALGGWGLWIAVSWLVAHAAHIAGGAAILALLWIGLGQLGACPGVHCPGCRHR
jgi:hypothetical protein